jgi:uncharacterized protein YprB with RNaseH-like and TPR domain
VALNTIKPIKKTQNIRMTLTHLVLSLIYFDLETTSLSRNSDITQIAAVHGSDINQTYVFPGHEISVELFVI